MRPAEYLGEMNEVFFYITGFYIDDTTWIHLAHTLICGREGIRHHFHGLTLSLSQVIQICRRFLHQQYNILAQELCHCARKYVVILYKFVKIMQWVFMP